MPRPRAVGQPVVSERRAGEQRVGEEWASEQPVRRRDLDEVVVPEQAATAPALRAPESLASTRPVSAPYPTLRPVSVPTAVRSRKPGASPLSFTPLPWHAAAPSPEPVPVREPGPAATTRWPELPPPAPAGTARMQRRLSDWGADLVRIQEVG